MVLWRKRGKYESKRRRHKANLLRYIHADPTAIRQEIKRDCNAAFFWFYQNEKQWLEQTLPNANKTQQVTKVDWVTRDETLTEKVEHLLQQHVITTRADLDRQLGNHGWLTRRKDKLPLTMEILKQHGIK